MSLITSVLVRGINNLSDARYCAGMGADGLIFTLDPTLPGAVDAATVKELAGWVAGVELVGEFGAEVPVSEINRLVEECGLTRVLLHTLLPDSALLAVPVIMQIPPTFATNPTYLAQLTAEYQQAFPASVAFLTELPTDAEPLADIAPLATAAATQPLWLSGPITAGNVQALLATVHPAGLILQGGDEIKPGLRDFEGLEEVFEALEELS